MTGWTTKIIFIFYMNLLEIGERKRQREYWKDGGYIILTVLAGICLINLYQLMTFGFQAERILTGLKEWSYSQTTKKQLDVVLQISQKVGDFMGQFDSMIDQQDYLLVKIKQHFIDDNREEADIPEIVNFQTKLRKYKLVQNSKGEEHKAIMQKVNRLKYEQGRNIVQQEDLKRFAESSRKLSEELRAFGEIVREIVEHNKEWYTQVVKQINKSPQIEVSISLDEVEDLQEYNDLPPLAQLILRPQPMQLLKLLYKSTSALHEQSQLQMRQKFTKQREYLCKQFRMLPSFSLSKYNIQSGIEGRRWENDIIGDYVRLKDKYLLDEIKQQLGFCIVVPTYNNFNNFRAQLNLNSIFSQNYTNYKVVIIDDASKDGTTALIQKYLAYYKIPQSKCELIVNKVNKKAMENIYNAITINCTGYEIITIVDGDDELVGLNTLKVLNAAYSRQNLGMVYSNFFYYQHNSFAVKVGFNREYNLTERENLRGADQRFSHLISFKRELFGEIRLEDLQENGHFYHVAYDFAMIYPMMELACGKVRYIDQYQYLYSIGTGMNDYELLTEDQKNTGKRILSKPAYECSQKYKQ